MTETKADIAADIAAAVDGVDPYVYEPNKTPYFDHDDLAALKRWIAEHDESLPADD